MARCINRLRSPHLLPWYQVMLHYGRVALFCGMLALAGGCQRGQTWNLAPVEGTVTWAGRPLAGIQVAFLADVEAGTKGPRASGVTDAAGHYELRTDAGDRGAAVGRYYRVCLLVPSRMAPTQQANLPKDRQRVQQENAPQKLVRSRQANLPTASDVVQLPPAFSSFAETPLRVEVQPGPQVIDLEVK